MQAKKQRDIRSGLQYEHLFPKASEDTHTVLKDAGVNDTVDFIPQVVAKTLNQTKGIANALRTLDDYGTCRNVWNFVYNHIAYKKDKDGYEQIRSPARSWHDRRTGVDCDCYTTLISSILTNLGIKHKLRITKYSRDYFQHIYPIALLPGKEVVLDCVTDKFDYEVPFSEKKDYSMDLQYLNGLEGIGATEYVDGYDEMAELGKLFKKKAKAKAGGGGGGKKKKKGFFKKIGAGIKKINIKKVLNVVNKLNPATLLLRNGVLASMKLNIGNVAKRLRWSYITPEQAKAKGMMMDRWNKLVKARKKLEEIFYGSGGKPENLKKAILQGKGNKDKGVHGFDGFYGLDGFYRNPHLSRFHPMHPSHPINRMTRKTPLRQLLGDEIFFSENSVQGLGQLGEPISGAMIAAAASIIATIAGVIKKIGDVFGGKGKGAKDFDPAANAAAEKEIKSGGGEEGGTASAAAEAGGEGGSSEGGGQPEGGGGGEEAEPASDEGEGYNGSPAPKKKAPAVRKGNALVPAAGGASAGGGGSGGGSALPASSGGGEESESPAEGGGGKSAMPMTITDGEAGGGGGEEPKPGFWDKNKKWIVPVGIGAAGLTVLALAAAAMKKPAPAPAAAKRSLNGPPRKKTKNYHRKTSKTKHTKVKAKALL